MGFFSRLFGANVVGRIKGPQTYSFDIVGESHYQQALESICGGRTDESREKRVTATLTYEDDNPHDNNAIRVDIDGEIVGYLNRELARNYRKMMKEAGHPGLKSKCGAMIVGGWDRGDGDTGYFGVKLDLPTPD